MNKRKYTETELKESTGFCSEPVVDDVAYLEEVAIEEDSLPVLGPNSYEEALADIELSEQEFEEGKTHSWETVRSMIEDKIRNYAY